MSMYKTIWHHNPYDHNLFNQGCENDGSYTHTTPIQVQYWYQRMDTTILKLVYVHNKLWHVLAKHMSIFKRSDTLKVQRKLKKNQNKSVGVMTFIRIHSLKIHKYNLSIVHTVPHVQWHYLLKPTSMHYIVHTVIYWFSVQCVLAAIREICHNVVSSQHIHMIICICWEETTVRMISLKTASMDANVHWREK
jgi:hypothetical protein